MAQTAIEERAEVKALIAEVEEALAPFDADVIDGATATLKDRLAGLYPAKFDRADDLNDSYIAEKTEEFVKAHLKRYPRNQGALTLSLKALLQGETDSYIR